jgi:hypothetical protein
MLPLPPIPAKLLLKALSGLYENTVSMESILIGNIRESNKDRITGTYGFTAVVPMIAAAVLKILTTTCTCFRLSNNTCKQPIHHTFFPLLFLLPTGICSTSTYTTCRTRSIGSSESDPCFPVTKPILTANTAS